MVFLVEADTHILRNAADLDLGIVLAMTVSFAIALAAFFMENNYRLSTVMCKNFCRYASRCIGRTNANIRTIADSKDVREFYFLANICLHKRHGECIRRVNTVLEARDFYDCKHFRLDEIKQYEYSITSVDIFRPLRRIQNRKYTRFSEFDQIFLVIPKD